MLATIYRDNHIPSVRVQECPACRTMTFADDCAWPDSEGQATPQCSTCGYVAAGVAAPERDGFFGAEGVDHTLYEWDDIEPEPLDDDAEPVDDEPASCPEEDWA